MGISVTIVSGPRRSGKSTIISEMVASVYPSPPHYLRLTRRDGEKPRPARCAAKPSSCGVASAAWVEYEPGRVFEVLPDALAAIERRDASARIVIEAESDPSLRHAFPYHARLFVMGAPSALCDVFRSCGEAAEMLRVALDDTATFATEVFGLSRDGSDDDSHQDLPDLTPSQMQRFLHSPLGCELALRSQLQPGYHALLESDVIVMNTAVGGTGAAVDDARRRLEAMVSRLQNGSSRCTRLFCCDFLDRQDPLRRTLLETLRSICVP